MVSMRVFCGLLLAPAVAVSGNALAQTAAPSVGSAQPPRTAAAPATGTPQPESQQAGWRPARDFSEFLQHYYRIFQVQKTDCVKISADRVRMVQPLQGEYELVREDAEHYYIRNLPIEDKRSFAHKEWVEHQYDDIRAQDRAQFMADKYIIASDPDVLPPFTDKLDFVRSDAGLPKSGRWVRSFAVADMNGDGRPDIILPPERMGAGQPSIWLNQGDGTWRYWSATRWPDPKVAKLDYGAVGVADFDGDGNPDIAIASHFLPAYVLYGNGKGDFTRAVQLPLVESDVTSQALAVGDFNHDGRPDLALEDELDVMLGTGARIKSGLVNVLLNLPGGWKANGDDFPFQIFGYDLTAGHVTGGSADDLVLTSREQGVRDLVFRNAGNGEKWESVGSRRMPFNSFVFAAATGRLDRFPQDDVVMCYEQFNPWEKETPTQACTIYRFHDAAGRPLAEPSAQLLLKSESSTFTYQGVAIGDIDGDGRNDIAIVSSDGKVHVFLQFPDGNFYEQKSPAFDLGADTLPTCVRIADLYHDGKGEIIVMGTTSSNKATSGGGLWVLSPRPKPERTAAGKVAH